MFLLPFWALNVSVMLLSMQDQRALRFHQKYPHLWSEDDRRSYGFGTTWGWVINERILIFGCTIPLNLFILFSCCTFVTKIKWFVSHTNIILFINIINEDTTRHCTANTNKTQIHMIHVLHVLQQKPLHLGDSLIILILAQNEFKHRKEWQLKTLRAQKPQERSKGSLC